MTGFSTAEARLAPGHLVGDDSIRDAVDYCIGGDRATHFVKCSLMVLLPAAAVERCLEIHRSDPNPERRHAALDVLTSAADADALPVVPELLEDPDPIVQGLGAALLDQLLWTRLGHPHEAELFLRLAEEHPNGRVREVAARIDDYLPRRGIARLP